MLEALYSLTALIVVLESLRHASMKVVFMADFLVLVYLGHIVVKTGG